LAGFLAGSALAVANIVSENVSILLNIGSVCPTPGTWSITGDLNFARTDHTATLLENGQVLVTGGIVSFTPLNKAELYDPPTCQLEQHGDLNFARWEHTATLLPNGLVLVAGGRGVGATITNKTELYPQ
jgi:hypothetical protein